MRVHGHSAAGRSAVCEAASTVTSPRMLRPPLRRRAAPGSRVGGRRPQTRRTRRGQRRGGGAASAARVFPSCGNARAQPRSASAGGGRNCRPGPEGCGGAAPRGGATGAGLEDTRSRKARPRINPCCLLAGTGKTRISPDDACLSLAFVHNAPLGDASVPDCRRLSCSSPCHFLAPCPGSLPEVALLCAWPRVST
jgi:hypothetical protein